jgi:hypothetical protein
MPAQCIAALPEDHWKLDREETDAIREWAEVNYLPSDGILKKDAVSPRRYLAIRVRPRQGELLRDGNRVRHFCIVTNRSDPEGGSGLDLIRWHRGKAGTIEHAHDVLMNELAGAALPSQKFGANAAWLRLNVILYNLLSAYKRVGLPEEFHTARPKRLRFLLLNTVAKVVRHARETLLSCTKEVAPALADAPHRPLVQIDDQPAPHRRGDPQFSVYKRISVGPPSGASRWASWARPYSTAVDAKTGEITPHGEIVPLKFTWQNQKAWVSGLAYRLRISDAAI